MNFLSKLIKPYNTASASHTSKLRSSQCTQAQLQSETFQAWVVQLHEYPMHMHRKAWEYCFITQALHERGMLSPGRRGLGFAVGQEPLSALFASLGSEIVATDLKTSEAETVGWVKSAEHASSIAALNLRGICDPELLQQRVSFRFLDMRQLPDDLGRFDFIWFACALEHLGSMDLGEQFLYDALKYLKPGGVAVHTTEFNVSSNHSTITEGLAVIFRKKDIQRIARNVRRRGYKIDLDFTQGNLPHDKVVDEEPYTHQIHLKLRLCGYTVTSYGLIIENCPL